MKKNNNDKSPQDIKNNERMIKIINTSRIVKRRKKYIKKDLENSLKLISQGASLRDSSNAFGVPVSTFSYKIKNPTKKNL